MISDLSPISELLQERERLLTEGTTEQIIDLAKEFHINKTFENSTTYYKQMVQKIKDRLTKDGYDWTKL